MYSLPLKTSISHPTWRWYRCWVYTSIRTAVILNASTYTLVLYKGDIYAAHGISSSRYRQIQRVSISNTNGQQRKDVKKKKKCQKQKLRVGSTRDAGPTIPH